MQRDDDAGGEGGGHGLLVERDDLHPRIGELVGEIAGPVAEGVVGVGDGQLDLVDADFQSIAGLRALDIDRAGEDVAAGALVGDGGDDVAQGLLDVRRGDAGFFERGG